MKSHLFAASLLFTLTQVVYAQADAGDVYLCVDSAGHKEYKNTGGTKGCKKVDLPGITTVPALPKRAAAPATATAAKPSMASPPDFPKVDNATQKARDTDRKQILVDEMKTEEQKLANLKKEFNNGEPERHGDERNFAKYQERVAQMKDDIGRTEKNIDALKRELGNTR